MTLKDRFYCMLVNAYHYLLHQITWRKDLHKIDFFATDHKYMLKETGSLFIDKADVTDTARFLCVVENPAGVVTREITLTIHGMT